MRQAIETKYHGPTNYRGSRVSATAEAGRIYVPWDYALGIEENHRAAAMAFRDKMKWGGIWVGGGTRAGFCFVDLQDQKAS